MSPREFTPLELLLLGALVPLVVGSLYATVSRYVKRRVTIKSPEAQILETVNAKMDEMIKNQAAMASTLHKTDCVIGSIVPALKITVKKVRYDLGRLDDGEEINGDLEEAWDEIKRAEDLHRGMRVVSTGC